MLLGDWSECPSECCWLARWLTVECMLLTSSRRLPTSRGYSDAVLSGRTLRSTPPVPLLHPAGCHFPCRGRDMTHAASVEHACPLCEAAVEVHDVRRIFDPISHCRRTVFAGMLAGSRKERP